MFNRLFGKCETRADRWKNIFAWLFVGVPAIVGWVSLMSASILLILSIGGNIKDGYTIFQDLVFFAAFFYFVFSGASLWFQIRAINATGKTTEHKIIETRIERPAIIDDHTPFDEGHNYEVERWIDRNEENGINSVPAKYKLNERQFLADLHERPPETLQGVKNMLDDKGLQKSARIMEALGIIQAKLQQEANERAIESEGGPLSPTTDLTHNKYF